MISENQVGEILSQRHRNESISHIARAMNLSRPTVRRYVNMLKEREGTSSVAITSQAPFEAWHGRLGSGKNADAIKDRLVNRSYRFMLGGTSLRKLNKVEL